MDLIADRGRRVTVEELNTSRLLAHARKQVRAQTIELSRLNEAFSILNASGTTVGSFGEGQPAPSFRELHSGL